MKQRTFKHRNIVMTEHDLSVLLSSFIAERKALLVVQFSGQANDIQLRRIQDLNGRIKATNQLLALGRVA